MSVDAVPGQSTTPVVSPKLRSSEWLDPPSVSDPIVLRRFTVDDLDRMDQAGVFAQVGRVELLDGIVFPTGGGDGPLRFTREQYYRMAEVGVLRREERVELIEGTIYIMSPVGSGHRGDLDFLADELRDRLQKRAIVSAQQPVHLDYNSEPEPDIAVIRFRKDYYRKNHPRPEDVFFIGEIMDSSAVYDRGVKLAVYARAGIPEVWLADIRQEIFEIHRQPIGGVYTVSFTRRRGETIAPEAFPDVVLQVDDILG